MAYNPGSLREGTTMDATRALEEHVAGDQDAIARLLPLVYDRLRAIAARYMRQERPGHTLRPTDLVHEAYIRIVDSKRISLQGKTHFYAIAARQMRHLLVESARAHKAQKRGGRLKKVTLDDAVAPVPGAALDILTLNEALRKLSELSSRQCDVVELRFFGGLNVRETAYVLGVSERTVKQDWQLAKAWLFRELSRMQGE